MGVTGGIVVLGLDPGFASLGYALVRLLPDGEEVLALGVLRTEKSEKKRKVLASDDNLRRTCELSRDIHALMAEAGGVRAICAEAQSWPRNASSAVKVALCWGAIAALTQLLGVPLVQATPQEIKKRLGAAGMVKGLTEADRLRAKTDSKLLVAQALRARYGLCLSPMLASIPATKHEHAYDALAALVTCLDSEVLRMARRMVA
jgi:Holliday junction resolvasome RuvABC endonuclease subunit